MPAESAAVERVRGDTVPELPRELYLEVTNRCNLRCHTCPQDFGMAEPPADLSVDDVERLVAPLPALDRVVLHGVGEPLLHRHLARIVAVVKAKGAHVLFNTNGTLLGEPRVAPLVRAGLDELRVSLDAADRETFLEIRGARRFDRILAGLARVRALKARLGSENPRVSLWMTGLVLNAGELPSLVRLAARLGIGEVYLQRLVTSGRGLAVLDQSLFGRPAHTLNAVDEAQRLAQALGVKLSGAGATTGAASVRPTASDAPWRGCRRPWTLTYVTANLNVLPCCIAPFTGVPPETFLLGSVRETPLATVWNDERYRSWRSRMLEGEPPEACRRCGTDWSL